MKKFMFTKPILSESYLQVINTHGAIPFYERAYMACIMKIFFLFHFFRSRVTTPYIYIFRGILFFLPKSKNFKKKPSLFLKMVSFPKEDFKKMEFLLRGTSRKSLRSDIKKRYRVFQEAVLESPVKNTWKIHSGVLLPSKTFRKWIFCCEEHHQGVLAHSWKKDIRCSKRQFWNHQSKSHKKVPKRTILTSFPHEDLKRKDFLLGEISWSSLRSKLHKWHGVLQEADLEPSVKNIPKSTSRAPPTKIFLWITYFFFIFFLGSTSKIYQRAPVEHHLLKFFCGSHTFFLFFFWGAPPVGSTTY